MRDGRTDDDLSKIGEGTSARNRQFMIRASGETSPFIEDGLRKSAADWGLIVDSGSDLKLDASLYSINVVEDGKWVGSKYQGRIEVAFELRDAQDKVLWVGRAAGVANRYGRKQNTNNVNEVLSDALKQAFVALMDTAAVRNALVEDAQ